MSKRKHIALILYALVIAADFFLLPQLIRDTGSAMVIMLCVTPLIVFLAALAGGAAAGFDWRLTAITAALFVPAIFRYYNESAWVYAVGYAAAALAGNALGAVMLRRRHRPQ